MALGSKVYDAVDMLILHQLVESIEITDVHLNELIVWTILDVLKVGKVTGIRKLVKVDDTVIWIFVHE